MVMVVIGGLEFLTSEVAAERVVTTLIRSYSATTTSTASSFHPLSEEVATPLLPCNMLSNSYSYSQQQEQFTPLLIEEERCNFDLDLSHRRCTLFWDKILRLINGCSRPDNRRKATCHNHHALHAYQSVRLRSCFLSTKEGRV
jgi:hypothetical protein